MVPKEMNAEPSPEVLRGRLIAIGGSAGAVRVLRELLSGLRLEVPIVIVLHVAPGRDDGLRRLFGSHCLMPVEDPIDKSPIKPGTVYFAPPDYHLLIENGGTFALSVEPKVNYCRPSIDVFFDCAADVYGAGTIGVVLSGANEDGAAGARRIRSAGGTVLVQEPSGCEVPTMPLAAIKAAAPQIVADVGRLTAILSRVCL